jgi:hypothetical protein
VFQMTSQWISRISCYTSLVNGSINILSYSKIPIQYLVKKKSWSIFSQNNCRIIVCSSCEHTVKYEKKKIKILTSKIVYAFFCRPIDDQSSFVVIHNLIVASCGNKILFFLNRLNLNFVQVFCFNVISFSLIKSAGGILTILTQIQIFEATTKKKVSEISLVLFISSFFDKILNVLR